MSLLIFRRFQNRAAICSKPCFCDRSKEAVLVSGLRLPGKCFPKVLLGQCSCILESDSLSTFVAITSLAGKIIPYICRICNISRECVYLRRRRNIVGEATSFVRSTTLFAVRLPRFVSASGTMLTKRSNDVASELANDVVSLRTQTQKRTV